MDTSGHGWRRVASTHSFDYLFHPEELEASDAVRPARRLAACGVLLVALSLTFLALLIGVGVAAAQERSAGPGARWESGQSMLYYTLLVPLTFPVTIIVIYLNWLSMKFFKHA